jgi:hypothetical protein
MGLFKREVTFADLVGKSPRLLTKEWFSICSHKKGFWARTNTTVSDETGSYLRMVGDCKGCNKPVVSIQSLKVNEPT